MNSAAKVGLFMLVVLAVLGFFILRIEDLKLDRAKNAKKIEVLFDSVAGLDKKSAVRVAGVRVGKVSKIDLTDDGHARVELEIDEDVHLRKGATARVANLGLLGEKYIEVDPGPPSAPDLPDGKIVLKGSEPASFDDVTSQVSAIATDVKAITESLRKTLAGPSGEQRLGEIMENVRQITAQVRLLIEVNEGNVNATAANMRKITDDLRVEIPRIAASIDRFANTANATVGENRADVRVLVENLRTLSSDLKTTATNLNDITGQVKSGEGTVGKLLYSNEAHDKLTSALTSVESGVTELKNTIGRAGKIQMDLGIKSDYYAGQNLDPNVSFAGHSRSAVTMNLVPNPERNRFYNFEFADDPRGTRRQKIVQTDTDTNGVMTSVTRHETKFERGFLVSAQAGWADDAIRLRVGLFDSAGGFGADYRWNDRLSISGELYDFSKRRDDNPHLRMYGQYIFRKEKPNSPLLFITTGIDNPLNDTAFTIGGGIRWRDEDLKYLLGSVPLK
ncbi:MAG TPA: MlaD family protein [Thermoanaerobaculia bacterium]|nr:MlaD family protein [Thermoanaerobaculia bacterium]